MVLEEVNDWWAIKLKDIKKRFIHSIGEIRDDNFGIMLLSKYPLKNGNVIRLGKANLPSVYSQIILDDGKVSILGTHPPPPISKSFTNARNDQILKITPFVNKTEGPFLLLGDLNTTPWSPYFKKIYKNTRLNDSSRGRGFKPTWPAGNVVFFIPIDHVFYSDEIEIKNKIVGPHVGSDHYPLIIDFVLKK